MAIQGAVKDVMNSSLGRGRDGKGDLSPFYCENER